MRFPEPAKAVFIDLSKGAQASNFDPLPAQVAAALMVLLDCFNNPGVRR